MTKKIWFIYSNEVVKGPFDTETVREQLNTGALPSNCFIWWKGQREWMPVNLWENQLKQILMNEDEKSHSKVWYIDLGSGAQPTGPMTHKEMLAHLRGISSFGKVRLWTVGMPKWTSLFEMSDVIDQLGMSRREHDRAPLMGAVAITAVAGLPSTTITRAASISVGGMGINDAQGLSRGDSVQLVIKSPEFPNPIRVQAEVVYITSQGHAGLKFQQLHPETQSLIFDYVKKFMSALGVRKSA